jgi:N-acetylneuraminic acid mutarotase
VKGWIWLPIGLIALVMIGLPVAALTETGLEKDVKKTLGFDLDECQPMTNLASQWQEGPPLAFKRDEPRIGVIGGDAFLAGGVTEVIHSPGERLLLTPSDHLTKFDPRTETYTEMAPLPQPRNHVGAVVYRGDLYVLGGYGQRVDTHTTKHFYRYDPDEDRWSRMPDLPEPRSAMAVGVIGHTLIMAGGARDRVPTADAFAFDFDTRRWSRLPSMHSRREHVGDAVADGKLYVLGGRAPESLAVDTAERYDPKTRTWETLPRMPVPAGGLAAVAVGDRVIAIGGGNDEAATVTGAVQEFNPATGDWSLLSGLRTPRHGQGAAVLGDKIWVFGGSDCAYFHATDRVEWLRLPAALAHQAP